MGYSDIKAIETEYNGYRFRSRLEARWAVFFDSLRVKWLYELEGFDLGPLGLYLPDFYFPDWGCWGEVKPDLLSEIEYGKAAALSDGCLILDGMPDSNRSYHLAGIDLCDGIPTYKQYLDESQDAWGRVVIQQSASKGRLWFLFGEDIASYCGGYYYGDFDTRATKAAHSARFEHGETP